MNPREFDTIKNGNTEIARIILENEYVSKLDECVDAARDRNVTPDALSRCAFTMSAYLCNMSSLVATITAQANEAYSYRKYKQVWEFNRLGKSLTGKDKENITQENVFVDVERELIYRYVADYFKGKYDAYEKFVSVIQSRLGILKAELNKL